MVENSPSDHENKAPLGGTPRPIKDQVIVRQDGKNEHVGRAKILYAPQGSESWSHMGTVIAVGPGAIENGRRVPMELKVGDRVLFARKPKSALTMDATDCQVPEWKDLLVFRERTDLLLVVEEE